MIGHPCANNMSKGLNLAETTPTAIIALTSSWQWHGSNGSYSYCTPPTILTASFLSVLVKPSWFWILLIENVNYLKRINSLPLFCRLHQARNSRFRKATLIFRVSRKLYTGNKLTTISYAWAMFSTATSLRMWPVDKLYNEGEMEDHCITPHLKLCEKHFRLGIGNHVLNVASQWRRTTQPAMHET